MKNISRLLLTTILFLGLYVPALFTFADEASDNHLPKALDALIHQQQLQVLKQFKTDIPEINGYVLKTKAGKMGVLYTLHDFVISGSIIDESGDDLTKKYAAENIPKPDYAAAATALEKDKTVVVEGKKSAPVLYVIADPNCIFCHKFWDQTRDWVTQGKIQIRWVMVGFLKPSSAGRAAAIMAAKDKAKAYSENQEKFDPHTEEGSIAELNPVSKDLQDALQQHATLMVDLSFQGTPGLLYKGVDGHWQGVAGAPSLQQLALSMGLLN